MPKILVADDNSNIQKMVGLALKDQGIDVVAVGNGEAAVRKIADVRPDLVLADVFMPVRNGYEVCQFVKMDSSLAHIPVILLVGAFDPLDEQEAQRVGADGVLKKPFIPPDPLISMVKSALQRSGAVHTSEPVARAHEPEPVASKEALTPARASAPVVTAAPVQEFHMADSPVAATESFVEEVPARPEPIKIDAGSQPVAFGSLLETPAETTPEDASFVTSANPEFAMEHDWRDGDDEEMDDEQGEEEPAGWRPEGAGNEEEVPAAKAKKPKSSASDWRMGGFEVASRSRSMGWEPEEETSAPAETLAPAASSRGPVAPPAPPAPTHEPPAPPAVSSTPVQETTPAARKPVVEETWTPPVAPMVLPATNAKRSAETATAVVDDKTKTTSELKPATEKKEEKGSWFSVSSSPWEGEIQKANHLASTWDAPAANQAPAPKNGTEKAFEVTEETKAVIEEAAIPPATVEAIREEAALVTENTEFELEAEAPAEGSSFYAKDADGVLEPNSASPTEEPPAAPNMDDLVAKVLAKMNPDMLQAVTREILKPVVEAMVKEELKSKKQ